MNTLCVCGCRREDHAAGVGACAVDRPTSGPCECMKFREPTAVTATFSVSEVRALEQVVAKLLEGGDVRVLARSPAVASIALKVKVMRKKLDERRSS